MTDTSPTASDKRSIWVRALLMVLMALAFYVSAIVLAVAAIFQFVMVLVNRDPNARLMHFGRSLGVYLSQIGSFVCFATEEPPFPFGDWPSPS